VDFFKLFYLKARLLSELVSFGVGEVVVREGGIQSGNQMEQSFPAHINSGMNTSLGRRHSAWKSDGTVFSCTHQFRNGIESRRAEVGWKRRKIRLIRILDPDPAIFVIDLQDASKKQIFEHNFFCLLLLLFEGTFMYIIFIFKEKKSKRVTKE
jgi:hypothetical protein